MVVADSVASTEDDGGGGGGSGAMTNVARSVRREDAETALN